MGEVKVEISNAIKTLGLQQKDVSLLNKKLNAALYFDLLNYFVKSGDRRWWWEDFKQNSFDFIDYEKPFEHIVNIIPDLNKNVWLMVEDDQEDCYPIYDCNPSIIGQIIGECFGFEYYIFDKNKKWLICENHHNRLIAIGQKLKEKNIDRIK